MSQPIVLPKFKLPGQRSNWTMRALLIAGGVVVSQMLVLTLVLVKRQSDQNAALVASAEQQRLTAQSAPTAPAPSELAASNAAAGKNQGNTADGTPSRALANAASSTADTGRSSADRTVRKARPARQGSSRRMLAKASNPSPKTATASRAKSDAAIDDILRRFR